MQPTMEQPSPSEMDVNRAGARTQIGSVTVWFVQKQTVTHEISSSTSVNVALFVQDRL